MRIVVLDGFTLNPSDNPWDDVASLGELTVHDKTAGPDIVSRSRNADIILTNKTPLSADTIAALPNLKFIGVLATGYNIVDIKAARERGIPVSNVPVYGTDSVAQFTFALILEMCHHVGHHNHAVHNGRWAAAGQFCFWDTPLIELAGKTIGIVGFGRIGQRVGEVARAFGMKVLAADTYRGNPPAYPFEWREIPDLFAESDVVTLHCPQTPDNGGMVNRELLAKMKPTAFFVNTARGGLVNERDLADAANSGVIAGAACDVVSAEPISPENPLLHAKNILVTPHIAWATLAARKRLMKTTAENIAAFIDGKPTNVVN
ncbi:MAG: D-2-hydroxyacid dehydrogenase [Candidatus Sumerlaeaceae bacterium]|nr:D-2-hydroxyacid dehydrogenase [Candidatus Sumerlaeaceae bacterium]